MVRIRLAAWALATVLLSTAPALAQSSVVIWPVDPRIAADQSAAALWLENRGAQPVTLQVRTFAWDQATGEDAYREQDAVVASPPIAQVGPGERQLVRLIRRAPDGPGEHAYRLLIDELPQPRQTSDQALSAHLAVQMRYSVPLFTFGTQPVGAAPTLSSRVELSGGKRWLVVANGGSAHARLTDLRTRDHQGEASVRPGLIGYVLPGATMRWELPADAASPSSYVVAVNGRDHTLGVQS